MGGVEEGAADGLADGVAAGLLAAGAAAAGAAAEAGAEAAGAAAEAGRAAAEAASEAAALPARSVESLLPKFLSRPFSRFFTPSDGLALERASDEMVARSLAAAGALLAEVAFDGLVWLVAALDAAGALDAVDLDAVDLDALDLAGADLGAEDRAGALLRFGALLELLTAIGVECLL